MRIQNLSLFFHGSTTKWFENIEPLVFCLFVVVCPGFWIAWKDPFLAKQVETSVVVRGSAILELASTNVFLYRVHKKNKHKISTRKKHFSQNFSRIQKKEKYLIFSLYFYFNVHNKHQHNNVSYMPCISLLYVCAQSITFVFVESKSNQIKFKSSKMITWTFPQTIEKQTKSNQSESETIKQSKLRQRILFGCSK